MLAAAMTVTVLLYHRFGPVVRDSTTVETSAFESQMRYLRDNGYSVIALREVVDRRRRGIALPPKCVAITADDGHRSVYTDMLPIVARYGYPVTLFLYPSAISKAKYALTWEELEELERTGLFQIESHTLWHPDFRVEKRRLPRAGYEEFVKRQLAESKQMLERNLHVRVELLAWPYGISNAYLRQAAREAGYVAAFAASPKRADGGNDAMALPRICITGKVTAGEFARMLARGPP